MISQHQKFEKETPPEIAPEIKKLEEKITERQKEFGEEKEVEKTVSTKIASLKKEASLKAPAVLSSEEAGKDAKEIALLKGEKSQTEALLKMAQEKGVYHATRVAKKLNDPYILDVFHDHLVSDFYDSLVRNGKIKPL